ncbi:hypothetical protein HC776_02825 [bacterium]|nr:hypothetical protein [bacterium]
MYHRGFELKVQLARAAIAGMEAIWSVAPHTRMVHVDPMINIVCDPERPYEQHEAEGKRFGAVPGVGFAQWSALAANRRASALSRYHRRQLLRQ